MPVVTIVLGFLLSAMGAWAYFGSETQSVTALIPAFFGIPLIIAGVIARNERLLKHAMHAAAMLALLGALGAARGLPKLPALLKGEDLERPKAVGVQSAMAILCFVFLILCIRSFINARKAREA